MVSWKWRRDIFQREHALVRELIELVEGVVLKEGVGDKWVWRLDPSGAYSVKSAYKSLVVSHQNIGDGFLCRVCNKVVPPKITAFVWRLAQDRIYTF